MFGGSSGDALLLTAVKLMTMLLSLVTTRLLSQYLTTYDYGTYSQVLLISSTIASITILGMMDGMNFFFCSSVSFKLFGINYFSRAHSESIFRNTL